MVVVFYRTSPMNPKNSQNSVKLTKSPRVIDPASPITLPAIRRPGTGRSAASNSFCFFFAFCQAKGETSQQKRYPRRASVNSNSPVLSTAFVPLRVRGRSALRVFFLSGTLYHDSWSWGDFPFFLHPFGISLG